MDNYLKARILVLVKELNRLNPWDLGVGNFIIAFFQVLFGMMREVVPLLFMKWNIPGDVKLNRKPDINENRSFDCIPHVALVTEQKLPASLRCEDHSYQKCTEKRI